MIFQNNRHKQIFEAERLSMRKPGKKTLAVLYLLTADHTLWLKTKHLFTPNGKVDLKSVRLGNVSTDSYALWKAVKELQTGEKQISLYELADNEIVSDNAFRLIVQAASNTRRKRNRIPVRETPPAVNPRQSLPKLQQHRR